MDPQHAVILDVFADYLEAAVAAAYRGEPEYPQLDEYAEGPALLQTRAAIRGQADNGRRYSGVPGWARLTFQVSRW